MNASTFNPKAANTQGHALSLYNRPSNDYAAKLSRSVRLLRSLASQHPRLVQGSSLSVEDMVVTELIQQAGVPVSVFVLDTGKLHPETLALVPAIEQRYGISVQVFRPVQEQVVQFVRDHGEEAMYQSVALRKTCCAIRKLEPLQRALSQADGWITGLRREQSNARAVVPDFVEEDGRIKINPLADWTWGDVWHFVAEYQVPYNPLHDAFFPSIGCAPCTRAISVGEDFRAGRWWWEDESAKECGLHVKTPTNSEVSA